MVDEAIEIESGGRTLSGRLISSLDLGSSPVPGPAVLFVHGLEGDQQGYVHRARDLVRHLPVACLTFDLSGHGESSGRMDDLTPRDHVRDLEAAYDRLAAASGVDPTRIGVFAASYGAYLTVWLSGGRPLAQILLRAPALYGDRRLDESLSLGRRTEADADASYFFSALQRLPVPLTLAEGTADEVVPPDVLERYRAAAPRSMTRTIVGAKHVLDAREREVLLGILREWARTL
jgi:pimeloyl-ACP methyl ester carboxylesterase